MSDPLQVFTNQTLLKICSLTLAVHEMSYENLKDYYTGLKLYKPELAQHIKGVYKQMQKKEPIKKRAPTTAEKPKQKQSGLQIGWRSSFFGFLRSLGAGHTQKAKSKQSKQSMYQSLPCQEQDFQCSQPSVNKFYNSLKAKKTE